MCLEWIIWIPPSIQSLVHSSSGQRSFPLRSPSTWIMLGVYCAVSLIPAWNYLMANILYLKIPLRWVSCQARHPEWQAENQSFTKPVAFNIPPRLVLTTSIFFTAVVIIISRKNKFWIFSHAKAYSCLHGVLYTPVTIDFPSCYVFWSSLSPPIGSVCTYMSDICNFVC